MLNRNIGHSDAALKVLITEREKRIAQLQQEIAQLRSRLTSSQQPQQQQQAGSAQAEPAVRHQPASRPVEVTRVKRRQGEAGRKAMREKHRQQQQARNGDAAAEKAESNAALEGRSFLYVGGRDCQVAHLRQIASAYGANLIHHDGGLREAVSRIDNVLPSVDCVFCPIDCISHDACLRVKTGCKKWEKAFVPLRNGSKSSFERALQSLSQGDNVQ